MIEKKNWGYKDIISISDTGQLDYLVIDKGGFSSRHKHFQMYNLLYILKGKLEITLFLREEERKYIIGSGEVRTKFIIRPGTYHQFVALEETHAIEYSFVKFDQEDIVRENEGGILKISA